MALQDEEDKQLNGIETSQTVLTLLTEIIVEILARLPVDSLLRCRSVCKLWRSLISDPRFVKYHLAMSTSNNHYAHHRLIFSTRSKNRRRVRLKSCHVNDVLYGNFYSASELDSPLTHPRKSVKIVGSCNGLVCIVIEDDGLYIWNPSTRKSNRLPSNGYFGERYWPVHYSFGYEESANDYKVYEISFVFTTDRFKYETSVMIYSSRNGNWKNIGTFPHDKPLEYSGKFLNGALHWVARNVVERDYSATCSDGVVQFDWHIIFFDLAKETYGELPMYDLSIDSNNHLTLGCLREWLCVLSNCRGICADLWVMKAYGVKDSWTKLVSIPYMTDPGTDRFSMPLCISNDGKVLLKLGWKLIVYDSKNSSFSEIQNFGKSAQNSTFIESLVSPMPSAGLGDRD